MNAQIVTVNLIPELSAPAVVRVSQYDVGRPLVFRVMDGMSMATLPQYWSAKVEGTKPSGLGFSESCTISGSTVTVSTTEAMTQECGQIYAEISLTYTGVVIGTANFILAVEPSPHPDGTTDGTQETMANLETRLQAEIDDLSDRIDDIEAGGSGLSSTEKQLILTLFSKAAYAEDDAGTAYDALENLWTTSTQTITYSLSHVTSSNTTASIESGQSYTTTLTADSNYTLNTVTVTMGGVDITSTSYSSGTVSIPSVTGNIVITATAVLAAGLYPFVSGRKTFADGSVLTISNGNHVKFECASTFSGSGSSNPLFSVSNIEAITTTDLNNPASVNNLSSTFSLGSTDAISFSVDITTDDVNAYSIQSNMRKAGATQNYSNTYRLSITSSSGASATGTGPSGDVSCVFMFFETCTAGCTYEFDFHLTVNNTVYF